MFVCVRSEKETWILELIKHHLPTECLRGGGAHTYVLVGVRKLIYH